MSQRTKIRAEPPRGDGANALSNLQHEIRIGTRRTGLRLDGLTWQALHDIARGARTLPSMNYAPRSRR